MSARSSRDYAREEATVRGAWLASSGETDAARIATRAGCSLADATRVALVRAHAAPELVSAWLDQRLLGWRHLARIALVDAPGDPDAQVSLASEIGAVRRHLERLEKKPDEG